jgi:hypothetical protein
MVSVPFNARFPVLGSVMVAYETVPGSGDSPMIGSKNEVVPVGAMVLLHPTAVVISATLDPAFTLLTEGWSVTDGIGHCTYGVATELEG